MPRKSISMTLLAIQYVFSMRRNTETAIYPDRVLLGRTTPRKLKSFYKGVSPLAQTKYFANVRICIFYTKYANGMIGQGGWEGREHSPTAQNMNSPKQNLHSDFAIHCTLHDSSSWL